MEPTTGLEPVNLFLTKEVLYLLSYVGTRGLTPQAHIYVKYPDTPWSGKRDSNPRPSAWKADALAN